MRFNITSSLYSKTSNCLVFFSLLFNLSVAEAQSNKKTKMNNEGTLFGAIQNIGKSKLEAAEGRLITGTISSNTFLQNPYILVDESPYFVYADKKGQFSITVPEGKNKLVFGATGIASRTFELNNTDHYDLEIRVEENHSQNHLPKLYGTTIDRRTYNGAFYSISQNEIRLRSSAVTIATMVEGVVPGLQVYGTDIGLGSDLGILIRGVGSLNASNAPLVILDGAPYSGSLNMLNPLDISNITVLKDGIGKSAYGLRGGNGIILITTKGRLD